MDKLLLLVGLSFVLAILASFISAAFVMLGWNLGAVVFIAAVGGGAIAKVGFWASFWFALFVITIAGLLKGTKVESS